MNTPESPPRRRRSRRTLDTSVASPCIAICQLHDVSGRCTACLRSTDQIREWMIMTREEKLAVLAEIKFLRAQPDPHQDPNTAK